MTDTDLTDDENTAAEPARVHAHLPGRRKPGPRPGMAGAYKLPRNNRKIADILTKNGGLIAPSARMLGVSRQSLAERISKEPELVALRRDLDETLLDLAEGHLMNGIRSGNQKDVHFVLRTKGRPRGYNERLELGGAGGGPVAVQVIIDGDDAKL